MASERKTASGGERRLKVAQNLWRAALVVNSQQVVLLLLTCDGECLSRCHSRASSARHPCVNGTYVTELWLRRATIALTPYRQIERGNHFATMAIRYGLYVTRTR